MARSRSFSIYLLKLGFDATNALKEDHALDDDIKSGRGPGFSPSPGAA